MLELKVILVLLARRFSFKEGYDELAARRSRLRSGWFGGASRKAAAVRNANRTGVSEAAGRGDKADLAGLASSKPRGGVSAWVSEAGSGGGGEGKGVEEVEAWGGKAYYISLATNKPKLGIPVWVEDGGAGKGTGTGNE
jgi:hypothetical protein